VGQVQGRIYSTNDHDQWLLANKFVPTAGVLTVKTFGANQMALGTQCDKIALWTLIYGIPRKMSG